jgi:PTH1 family peptidyl-tRNA hydrolase
MLDGPMDKALQRIHAKPPRPKPPRAEGGSPTSPREGASPPAAPRPSVSPGTAARAPAASEAAPNPQDPGPATDGT